MNLEPLKQIIFTLEKLPDDIRDFSHHKVFGTIAPANIPLINFSVSPLPPIILDQINLDFCAGFSSSEINTDAQVLNYSLVNYLILRSMDYSLTARAILSVKYNATNTTDEYLQLARRSLNGTQNLIILAGLMKDNGDYCDPLYQMAKIKQVRGEWQSYGANLRDAAQALVKYGSIKKNQSPFTYGERLPSDRNRDFLANWNNWPIALDLKAIKMCLGSFFSVDGPYDAFDNIRSALYLNYKSGVKIAINSGLNWRPEWNVSPGGIVSENYDVSAGGPHAIKLFGQVVVNNIPYIAMQQSWGNGAGNNGVYLLSRKVINNEFKAGYGTFCFKQLPKVLASYYNENGILATDNWFGRLLKALTNNPITNLWKQSKI